MQKPLKDFLKDCIIYDYDASEAWQRTYFTRFRAFPEGTPSESEAWLRSFLTGLATENVRAYNNQGISPKAYSYLLFIWKVFDLCAHSDQYDPAVVYHLWAYPIQASLSEEEEEAFWAAWKENLSNQARRPEGPDSIRSDAEAALLKEERYIRLTLEEIPTLMVKALIRFGRTEIIKSLTRFLYCSYEDKLHQLLSTSDSREAWLQNVADLIPYLLLKNFIPVHDTVVVRNAKVIIAEYSTSNGAAYLHDPGTVSRVSRFFRNLFTVEEILTFEQSGQRISETFAHVYPIVLEDIEEALAKKTTEIMEEAQQKGRLQGRQLASFHYRSKFSIPKYVYEEIKARL
jgi:hypothetical protein